MPLKAKAAVAAAAFNMPSEGHISVSRIIAHPVRCVNPLPTKPTALLENRTFNHRSVPLSDLS